MKNADDAIDRVLAGLRDVATPAGMERRILAAMEDSAAAPARAGWWFARPAVAVTCGVAVAALIAIAVIVPAIHRLGRVAERGSSAVEKQVPSISVSAGSPLPLLQAHSSAGITASEVAGEKNGSRTFAERLTAPFSSRPEMGENNAVRPAETNAGGDSDIDAVAMSETMAASFPAPPMPLTEQERLLLRMVHRGEPVELAMLDPRIVAMRDWEEKAEFREVSVTPVAKDAADGSGPGQAGAGQGGAGTAQSNAEPVAESVVGPAAESVVGPAAEGLSPAAGAMEQTVPEKTVPAVANPEQPNVKDGVRQQVTTVEKE